MSKRICQLMEGLGTVEDVISALSNLPPSESTDASLLRITLSNLQAINASENGKSRQLAIGCAILNEDFRKSGWLFRVKDTGGISVEYFATDKGRELIADALGL